MAQVRKAAVYARFSSDNQRDESIDAQVRAVEDYAQKNSIEIIKIYVDKAKSATSDKRPEFQKMIKDSELGIFDTLIVHKLDRFSRNKYDSAVYKRKLKVNGIRLISVTENLDGSPESIILESVIEGMAEYYSQNLAREVMKGMRESAYQCKHLGGIPPLGYDVDNNKKYVINEKEAEVVRKIFELYVNGYGYGQIIEYMNNHGYKTKKGREFGKNSIYGILYNEKYSGIYIFNRSSKKDAFGRRNTHSSKNKNDIIRVEGGIPTIITKDIYEKAREMMASRKRAPGANKAKEIYLLQGIIVCGHCGYAMQGNRRKPKNKPLYISYRCGCRKQKGTCDNKEIRKEYIEEFVLSELEKHILNNNAIPILVDKINRHIENQTTTGRADLKRMQKELKEVKEQIDNIVSAITKGLFHEEFKVKMDELHNKKNKLELNIRELESKSHAPTISEEQIRNLFSMFRSFVMERNLPECKKFIQNYVNKVIVYKDHVEVIFNVAFDFLEKNNPLCIKSSIDKKTLFKIYKNIA